MTTYPHFADTNRADLLIIPETTWATTPASGTARAVRITSHSLGTKKSTVVSNEIRADRMVSDIIETEMMNDGNIAFEFSAGAVDDLLAAFVLGAWSGTTGTSTLTNPSSSSGLTITSFSAEAGFTDVGQYFLFTGMRPSSFSLDINSSAIVTGTVDFMGCAVSTSSTSVLGASPYTVATPSSAPPLNATTDVGVITKNGTALTTAIKQIKLDGKANLRNQMAVGSKYPAGIGTGRFDLTGSFQAYFANLSLYTDFLAHNTVSLSWTLTDELGNSYDFLLPAVKITADPITAKGIDQDVMEDISFTAFRDPTSGTMLSITRTLV